MSQLTIKEIEKKLASIHDEQDMFLKVCEQDSRKGVQVLLQRWKRNKASENALEDQYKEMTQYEHDLYIKGFRCLAGVDEVGRGPLAGPVVAAAVILPQDAYLPGLNDSKKLSEQKREELFQQITECAISIGIGIIPAHVIDDVNIYQATKLAMKKALLSLSVKPDHLLVDAMEIPIDIPQTSIIKGDAKSVSIAASSIIAKVTRDRLMVRLSHAFPQYGFEKHMGYGTAYHLEALKKYGVISEHRRSFAPIRELIEAK
ncbi:ribonuclease HII [Bacillus sp. REN16]|uniref:ribonuclease HII n=1 Tax=Bacillus sp. REN16 TaxID=2887296 RepID=UPI001E3D938B|nr:ribonuclease HII [Bacillus sp. REN16]MCC3357490.1 ribonuclease HII [Bacillus sp. REN16]